jgi:hypothetical protein
MPHILPENLPAHSRPAVLSPLMLGDRLIELAKDADQAGLPAIAERLIRLACDVLEGGREDPGEPSRPAKAGPTPLPLCGRGRRAQRGE